MIGVLTLFGETDLQPVLRKSFKQHNISFLEENCVTSVQFMNCLEKHGAETDVAIIYSGAMRMEGFDEVLRVIRGVDARMRVLLILNGSAEQFLTRQRRKYHEQRVDLLYDDDGFDLDAMLSIVEKGKLPHREFRQQDDFLDETTMQASADACAELLHEPICESHTNQPFHNSTGTESFLTPKRHFVIGVVNCMRGAGATRTTLRLARYFSMQNFITCAVDFSATEAMRLADCKQADILVNPSMNIEDLREKYQISVVDFGTPYNISPDGRQFKIAEHYQSSMIYMITDCDIKIILGSTEPWNLHKLGFFFTNEGWQKRLDSSYLFLVPEHADRLRRVYPSANVLESSENYLEVILETVQREG